MQFCKILQIMTASWTNKHRTTWRVTLHSSSRKSPRISKNIFQEDISTFFWRWSEVDKEAITGSVTCANHAFVPHTHMQASELETWENSGKKKMRRKWRNERGETQGRGHSCGVFLITLVLLGIRYWQKSQAFNSQAFKVTTICDR